MSNVKRIALAGILTAVGVITSTFYIPVGAAKCFPIQAIINILSGVFLGPAYAVGVAFSTSTLRVLLGTGSILAYPGSMIGALCCALLYKYTHNLYLTYIGEVIGTGILGALAAYPLVTLFLPVQAAIFTYVLPFVISSFVGSTISIIIISILQRVKILDKLLNNINL
ncbi:MAG: energy coupling factor transporter S component ThiW [Oscillospiraceae bacterium]